MRIPVFVFVAIAFAVSTGDAVAQKIEWENGPFNCPFPPYQCNCEAVWYGDGCQIDDMGYGVCWAYRDCYCGTGTGYNQYCGTQSGEWSYSFRMRRRPPPNYSPRPLIRKG